MNNLRGQLSPAWRKYGLERTPKRKRKRGFNWARFLTAMVLAVVVYFMITCGAVRAADNQTGVLSSQFSVQAGDGGTVSPWVSGSVMGLLFFFTLVLIVFAARKMRENEEFYARLRSGRVECDETGEPIWPTREEIDERERLSVRDSQSRAPVEDVFEPLRGPGERLGDDEVERILIACAAEGRCVMKHVRRAQTTLSVDDYADELAMAERKLDSVIRCMEALVARLGDKETIRQGHGKGGEA